MDQKVQALLLLAVLSHTWVLALSNNHGMIGLRELGNLPHSWKGSDPCGTQWEGLRCNNSNVVSVRLPSMGLVGQLTENIEHLSELQILDLSYNKKLTGKIPQSIGNLKKLSTLILAGCGFSGEIPGSIGSLSEMEFLSLNSNDFDGPIPPSISNLSKLIWLDITDNKIEGPIPVSSGSTPGFDKLLRCRHFHLGKNQLTGLIPDRLFSSNMNLIHLVLDHNRLNGTIPSTVGFVHTLEVIDMSNNSFEASDFPSWFSSFSSLKALALDDAQLQGKIPADLFNLPKLETVSLKNNHLSGSLEINSSHGDHLKVIDLQGNSIIEFENGDEVQGIEIILLGNPICTQTGLIARYCNVPHSQSRSSSYVTEKVAIPVLAVQIRYLARSAFVLIRTQELCPA